MCQSYGGNSLPTLNQLTQLGSQSSSLLIRPIDEAGAEKWCWLGRLAVMHIHSGQSGQPKRTTVPMSVWASTSISHLPDRPDHSSLHSRWVRVDRARTWMLVKVMSRKPL